MFINQVREQLKNMSENEKDEWILDRARLVSESEQSGFLATLTGKKKLVDIPNLQQIDVFCRKVRGAAWNFRSLSRRIRISPAWTMTFLHWQRGLQK